MIHLKDTDLYVEVVPKEAKGFRISNGFIVYNLLVEEMRVLTNTIDAIKIEGNENYECLGEVTADEMSFDPQPIIESLDNNLLADYRDTSNYFYDTKFRLLLEANGVYFKNPKGDMPPDIISSPNWDSEGLESDIEKWQSYQSKVIEKAVILKKIK